MDKTSLGAIKWFDQSKAFGMLTSPDEKDVFFHVNSFRKRPETLHAGQVILFKKVSDQKNPKRLKAENCKVLEDVNDWPAAMEYLDRTDKITFEDPNAKHPRNIHQSLLELSFTQLMASADHVGLIASIKRYFDNGLVSKNFIPYCSFLERMFTKNFGEATRLEVLKDIFSYFGSNMDAEMLFHVWKSQQFHYIGYEGMKDYEIPIEVLQAFVQEIDQQDLERIGNYSYSEEFNAFYESARQES